MPTRFAPSSSRRASTSPVIRTRTSSGQSLQLCPLTPLLPVARQPRVRLLERGSQPESFLVEPAFARFVLDPRTRDELLLPHAALDALGPHAQVVTCARDVFGHILEPVHNPEVDQGEPLGLVAEDLVERPLPALEIDVGRRSVGQNLARGEDPDAAGIAGVERFVFVQVADVVGRVPRSREAGEADDETLYAGD